MEKRCGFTSKTRHFLSAALGKTAEALFDFGLDHLGAVPDTATPWLGTGCRARHGELRGHQGRQGSSPVHGKRSVGTCYILVLCCFFRVCFSEFVIDFYCLFMLIM